MTFRSQQATGRGSLQRVHITIHYIHERLQFVFRGVSCVSLKHSNGAHAIHVFELDACYEVIYN